MKELVLIQVGRCGNSIGSKFWETVCKEHGLNEDGDHFGADDVLLNGINIHFSEIRGLTYRPRSVLVDLDSTTKGFVRNQCYGKIFKADNFVVGSSGASTNWGKGHITEGSVVCDDALNIIRKEVENCDCFQGFQMLHSMGGGTGGGLASLLLSKISDEYPQRIVNCYSVLPQKVVSSVLEPYNAILTMTHLMEKSNQNCLVDIDALYNIIKNFLKIDGPTNDNFSHLSSLFLTGLTSCMRFPSVMAIDLRSIAVNLVPFPTCHFFLPGFSPIVAKNAKLCLNNSVPELATELFTSKNVYATYDKKIHKFVTAGLIFRGKLSIKDIECHMRDVQIKNNDHFVDWIPDKTRTGLCRLPPPGFITSASFLANTTAITEVLQRTILEKYRSMFLRKAFLHWYLEEGIEEEEFVASESAIISLINAYTECAEMTENITQSSKDGGQELDEDE